MSNDEQALAAVLNALHHSSGVPHERLRVQVPRGYLALMGIVKQEFERSLAEQAAASAAGVVEISNEIKLES